MLSSFHQLLLFFVFFARSINTRKDKWLGGGITCHANKVPNSSGGSNVIYSSLQGDWGASLRKCPGWGGGQRGDKEHLCNPWAGTRAETKLKKYREENSQPSPKIPLPSEAGSTPALNPHVSDTLPPLTPLWATGLRPTPGRGQRDPRLPRGCSSSRVCVPSFPHRPAPPVRPGLQPGRPLRPPAAPLTARCRPRGRFPLLCSALRDRTGRPGHRRCLPPGRRGAPRG